MTKPPDFERARFKRFTAWYWLVPFYGCMLASLLMSLPDFLTRLRWVASGSVKPHSVAFVSAGTFVMVAAISWGVWIAPRLHLRRLKPDYEVSPRRECHWMIRLAWLPALLLTLPAIVATVLLVVHIFDVNAGQRALFEHVIACIAFSTGLVLSVLFASRTAPRHACAGLAFARIHQVCFDCGYPLGASDAKRCPECGFTTTVASR